MVDAEHGGITRADIFFILGNRPIAKEIIPTPDGKPLTPGEEVTFGDQLRRELDQYEAPRLKIRRANFTLEISGTSKKSGV